MSAYTVIYCSLSLSLFQYVIEVVVTSPFNFYCSQAFVHDPLINWRLFNFNEVPQMSMFSSTHAPPVVNAEDSAQSRELLQPQRGARERELLQVKT